eukprot:gene3561-4066_t
MGNNLCQTEKAMTSKGSIHQANCTWQAMANNSTLQAIISNCTNNTYQAAVPVNPGNNQAEASNAAYHVILLIIASCIILTNAYALSLFMRQRALLTKSNYLLLSLALSEFMTGAVNIPLTVYAETRSASYEMVFVITADMTTILCAAITMTTLCGIIVDRYLVICFPMKYYSMITKRKVIAFIVLSWVLPFGVSFVRLVWLGPMLGISPKKSPSPATKAKNNAIQSRAREHERVYYLFGFCMYLFIITVLFVLFVLMFRAIKRLGQDEREFTTSQRNNAASIKRETKAVILFAVMYFAFIFCWSPLVVFRLLVSAFPACYQRIPVQAVHAIILIKYLTSVINPLLYIFYKLEFYQELKRDGRRLRRFWGCPKRQLRRARTFNTGPTEVTYCPVCPVTNGEIANGMVIHGNGCHERVECVGV